ncbi:MAG: RidA family protein [Cyclobacteriaceae bacterium]|nr:RidA family protein [Cyclobacteriaceae bacterium]
MSKVIINTDEAPEPIGPYSQSVLSNNTLYVSGQIPLDPETGNIINDSIESETERVMQNIGKILRAAGYSFDNVVKCSIFVKDLGNFARINEVYGKYFDVAPPARETVEVSRLPKDVNVEISCIATK